jgi:ribonuclease HII
VPLVSLQVPSLRLELARLAEGHGTVAGCDEVGRGSLAGPVSVGIVVVDACCEPPPAGLRDSKLLSPRARQALVPLLRAWATTSAVGHASAAEIDRFGIMRALRLAGERALASLPEMPDLVLLDGNYDWLSRPEPTEHSPGGPVPGQVEVKTKADLECASVAAASVLAKVERDRLMIELAVGYPAYGWHANKGYSAPEHRAALLAVGPCEEHRQSWHLLEDPTLFGPIELAAPSNDPDTEPAAARRATAI